MTDYTAHVMVPDVKIGGVFQDIVLGQWGVACATLRAGAESWLSIGLSAETDDEATLAVSRLRDDVKALKGVQFPEGYGENALDMFADSPMILTHGRTVVFSQGV